MNILNDKKAVAVFLLPALIFYCAAVFFPIAQSLFFSLISWNGVSQQEFVGLQNFIMLLKDNFLWRAVQNNLIYVVIVVFMQVFIGLAYAILLTYLPKGKNIIRTLYYVPAVIAAVAITQVFRNVYSYEPMGLINIILNNVGLSHYASAWLANPETALVAVSIPEGWRFIGMYMIIFYAALISISKEIEESAMIDGVDGMKMIFYIKLPLIRNTMALSLIMCTTGALRGFDIPYLLAASGRATELVTTYMYKKAFVSMQYGYGSAIAVFVVVESILAVFLIKAIFRKKEEQEG